MKRSIVFLLLAASTAAPLARVPAARAQGNPPGTVTGSAAITGILSTAADLDAGGELEWGNLTIHAGVTRQFVPAFAAGVSLRYAVEEWRIRSSEAFGDPSPWRHLRRPGASLNLSLALSKSFLVRVSPTVEWAWDSRAEMEDAAIYGAVLSAVQVFSPKLVLGGGASVTRQFYSVKASPFVIVNWQIADKFRIANAAAAGPLGGAGVELRYTPTAAWELAAGGVWRSDRWRIADPGPNAATVGETSSIPLLARVSRAIGTAGRLDFHAGVMTANRVTLRDDDGNDLIHDGYGPAPTIAATLSGKF